MKFFDEAYRHRVYMEYTLAWLNIPLQAVQLYLLLLAVFGREHWLLVAELVAVGVLLLDLAGWFAVAHKGWLKKQNSIVNQHNPELLQAAKRK